MCSDLSKKKNRVVELPTLGRKTDPNKLVYINFGRDIPLNCVVVDLHIQRLVLATEKSTVTQQVSHRLSNVNPACGHIERGTKVNGSHHGDNPLLRPTGIQIATKRYATLQAMPPTNVKTVHQTSLLHIESNFDRLGLLSSTHGQAFSATKRINYAPISLINKSNFLKATHVQQKKTKLKY